MLCRTFLAPLWLLEGWRNGRFWCTWSIRMLTSWFSPTHRKEYWNTHSYMNSWKYTWTFLLWEKGFWAFPVWNWTLWQVLSYNLEYKVYSIHNFEPSAQRALSFNFPFERQLLALVPLLCPVAGIKRLWLQSLSVKWHFTERILTTKKILIIKKLTISFTVLLKYDQ